MKTTQLFVAEISGRQVRHLRETIVNEQTASKLKAQINVFAICGLACNLNLCSRLNKIH